MVLMLQLISHRLTSCSSVLNLNQVAVMLYLRLKLLSIIISDKRRQI